MFLKVSSIEKLYRWEREGDGIDFLHEILFANEKLWVFLKLSDVDQLLGAKFSANYKGGASRKKMSRILRAAEKNRDGALRCFRNFLVSKKIIHKGGTRNVCEYLPVFFTDCTCMI